MPPPVAEVEALERAGGPLAAEGLVVVRRALDASTCQRWTRAVLAARAEWTQDFGGEQFSLGRAFYTHLETDLTRRYFEDAAASDARVERHAPGLQAAMRGLLAGVAGGRVAARPGWCGAGVHVFPAGGVLAEHGGVVHFDTEGLAEAHVARRARALSLVAMLQSPERGGGLRLWPVLYAGRDEADDAVFRQGGDTTVLLRAGDLAVFDSYRLHQIQPFEGALDRVSATLHGAEIDRGLWESWF